MLSSNDLTIAAAAGYFDAYKLDRLRILYLTSNPKLWKYQVQTTFSRPSHLVIKTEWMKIKSFQNELTPLW